MLFATLEGDLRTKVLHIIHMTTLDTDATVQASQAIVEQLHVQMTLLQALLCGSTRSLIARNGDP